MTGTRLDAKAGSTSAEHFPSRERGEPGKAEVRPEPRARASADRAPAQAGSEAAEFPLRNLSIRMDPETHRVVATVIDAKTGEVIRQIPPEELARLDRDLGPRPGRLVEREA